MIRALCVFFVLLGSVYLGLQLSKDPGYILIGINHWTVETTVWVAAFAVIFSFLILHLFLQACHKIGRAPGALQAWNTKRLTHKAQAITRKGLIEYTEGYWQKAKNHLIQALPNTDTPLLNYLTAARAAQKMGDSRLRDHYLREAQQSMPEAKIAVNLAPHHPYVLKLLMYLYQEVKDWPQLIALTPDLKKHQVISNEACEQLKEQAYLNMLIELNNQNQQASVTAVYNSLPKNLINNPAIVAEYVRFLIRHQDNANAEQLLRRSLRKEFNSQLIEQYGLLFCDEKQLAFAESLLKKNSHSAALYLCLGRLCANQQLWGKAKHYFEQANELTPTPATYFELGKLHEQLAEPLVAKEHYKMGLDLATVQ